MAEFLLDRLALKELDVVNDQHVDGAELFLEGDRRLRLQRGDEAIHEFLGCQIDDPATGHAGAMRDRLKQMRLAQANGGVEIKRIVDGLRFRRRAGNAFCRRMSQLVGLADNEIREGETAIQRRARKSLGGFARLRCGADALRLVGKERFDRRRCFGGYGSQQGDLARLPQIGTDLQGQLLDVGNLGGDRNQKTIHIVGLDPALQEAGGHAEMRHASGDLIDFQSPEPAFIDSLAKFRAKTGTDLGPDLLHLRVLSGSLRPGVTAETGRAGRANDELRLCHLAFSNR